MSKKSTKQTKRGRVLSSDSEVFTETKATRVLSGRENQREREESAVKSPAYGNGASYNKNLLKTKKGMRKVMYAIGDSGFKRKTQLLRSLVRVYGQLTEDIYKEVYTSDDEDLTPKTVVLRFGRSGSYEYITSDDIRVIRNLIDFELSTLVKNHKQSQGVKERRDGTTTIRGGNRTGGTPIYVADDLAAVLRGMLAYLKIDNDRINESLEGNIFNASLMKSTIYAYVTKHKNRAVVKGKTDKNKTVSTYSLPANDKWIAALLSVKVQLLSQMSSNGKTRKIVNNDDNLTFESLLTESKYKGYINGFSLKKGTVYLTNGYTGVSSIPGPLTVSYSDPSGIVDSEPFSDVFAQVPEGKKVLDDIKFADL